MAEEHIIDIYSSNLKWYVCNDTHPYYILIAQQEWAYADGDTVKLGPLAATSIDPPGSRYYGRFAQIAIATASDTACNFLFAKTAAEMSAQNVLADQTTIERTTSGRIVFTGTNITFPGMYGSATNGANVFYYCPVIWARDSAGKLICTVGQSRDYGENSYGPRVLMAEAFIDATYLNVNMGYQMAGNSAYIPQVVGSSATDYSTNVSGNADTAFVTNPLAVNKVTNAAFGAAAPYMYIKSKVGYDDPVTPTVLNFDDTPFSENFEEYVPNDNPYGDNPDAPGTGGDGSRTDWTDEHSLSDIPTFSALESGTTAVYTPTAAQMASFTEFLWSDLFSLDNFKKLFADPMQSIISLHALPFAVTHGLESQIVFGNISSGVNADVLGKQWYDIDLGTLDISEYYGNFFDYSPYTKYSIYLPYIGFREFIPDDFVRGTINLTYRVDALTGACSAVLTSSTLNGVAYIYNGDMAYHLPVTSNDYANFVSGIGSSVATGISAAKAIKGASGALGVTAAIGSGIASTVSSVASSKEDVSRSGSVGGATGWTADQTPYIIRTRPNAVFPKNAQSYQGFPSYQAYKLSSLSGFTKVLDCNLSLNGATSSEYDEALSLLKEGVII